MALGTFGVGPYTSTFNTSGASGSPAGKTAGSRSLGLVENVITLSRSVEGEDIVADVYGKTVIDGIYQGGQTFVSMIFKEWTIQVQDALWPFGGDSGDFGRVGTAGLLMTDLAGILTLTAVAGTPAASSGVGPSPIVFHAAIISPGHNFDVPFGSTQRHVPIVFRCYPTIQSTILRWFTATTPA